jgi:hypothetical protein
MVLAAELDADMRGLAKREFDEPAIAEAIVAEARAGGKACTRM